MDKNTSRINHLYSCFVECSKVLDTDETLSDYARRSIINTRNSIVEALEQVLTERGECPMCSQEYVTLDDTPLEDPLRYMSGSSAWTGKLEVETVDGTIEHEVPRGMGISSIGGLLETLYNLYQAGVDDPHSQHRNPSLTEAVGITVRLEKEVF